MPIEYSEDSLRSKLESDIGSLCKMVEDYELPKAKKYVNLGVEALRVICAAYAISTKRPEWACEQEFRKIVFLKKGGQHLIKRRVNADGISVPYLEVPVRDQGHIALAEIIIGAAQNADTCVATVKELLRSAGYSECDFEYPEISISKSKFISKTEEQQELI